MNNQIFTKLSNQVRKGDIYWIDFDPSIGTEIQKIRPAVIISNNRFNRLGVRFLAVPLTTSLSSLKTFEIPIKFNLEKGKIIIDQMRMIDKLRLGKYLGKINPLILDKISEKVNLLIENRKDEAK